MQIIKTTMIAILAAVAMIGFQTVKATSDNFKVRVTLEDVDILTGQLKVIVYGNNGIQQTQTIHTEGYAGDLTIDDFELPSESVRVGESFSLCVNSIDYKVADECITGENSPKKGPEEVSIEVPSGIGRPNDVTTYYDDDTGEVINTVDQGDDSTNTEKQQGSGIDVSFGDNSDHNTVNIDQRSTFADVIRELVPIAKEGAHMAKDTAAQLLN